jgi:hypothetical protein
LFKEANTEPLAACILPTPKHKTKQTDKQAPTLVSNQAEHRKSPKLQNKGSKSKTMIKMAQELVEKKCGILNDKEDLDNITLQ